MSNYSPDDVKKAELVVLSGLLANPGMFAELDGVDPNSFTTPDVRIAIIAAAEYRRRTFKGGAPRFPTPESILYHAEKLLTRPTGDKAKDKRNRTALDSFRRTMTDVGSWPDPGEHEFLDRLAFVRQSATDLTIRRGMLDAVELLRKGADHERISEALSATAATARSATSTVIERELSTDARSALSDYYAAKNLPNGIYIPTPWPRLNRVIGGLVTGRMMMWCAYAKQGKTIGASNVIYHASVGQVADPSTNPDGVPEGLSSLVISSEQGVRDIRNMMLTRHTHRFVSGGADFRGLTAGRLIDEHERAYEAAVDDLERNKAYGPIRYAQVPNRTTIREVAAIVAKHSRQRRVDVLMVDHTMLFASSSRQYDRVAELASILQELHDLTLSYDRGRGLAMVACHQIKREGFENAKTRGYYEPYDAGGTAEVERSCDVMVWSYFDDQLDEAGEIRMGVALDRHGGGDRKGWSAAKCFFSAAILPLEDA